MDGNTAAQILLGYLNNSLFEPSIKWPKDEFLAWSYSRWAVCEIVERLLDDPFGDAELIIETFLLEIEWCKIRANGRSAEFIFGTAKDTACDILNLVNLKGESI